MLFSNSKFTAAVVLMATFAMTSTFGAANFAPAALNQATVGTQTTQPVTITGGTYTNIAVTGITDNGTGFTSANLAINQALAKVTLSGVPNGAGTFSYTIQATEVGNFTSQKTYTLTVNPALSVTPPTLNGATIGIATNQTIQLSGGTTPYASLTVSGFTDNGTGLTSASLTPNPAAGQVTLSGTASGAGYATFTVNATDAAGAVLTKNYTLSVFQFFPTSFSTTQALSFTSQMQTITGGVKPYASIVPTNISAGSTGLSGSNFAVDATQGTVTFSGTPPTPGTFTFSIVVTDAAGNSFTTNNSIVITPAPISFTPASLAVGTATTNYNQTITAIGGTGNKTLTYAVALPPGLSISPPSGTAGANSITISGANPSAGTVTFNVFAQDTVGATGSASFTVTINLNYSPPTLLQATAGTATTQTITVSGHTGALNFNGTTASFIAGGTGLTSANLAIGANTVTLSGTPTAAGVATFSLIVIDGGSGRSLNIPYSLIVNPALSIAPMNLAQATVGTATNQLITISNGTTPYNSVTTSNYVTTGTPGINSSNLTPNVGAGTVLLSGTPSGAGTFKFDVNVTDKANATLTYSYTLTVNPSLSIAPLTLPGGDVGKSYNRTVTVSQGTPAYTALTVTSVTDSGSTGLTYPTNFVITKAAGTVQLTGTPTGTGTLTFTVTATDTAGATLSNTYSVVINPALTIAILPAAQAAPSGGAVALNPTTVGIMPVQTIQVANGTIPYTTFNVSNFSGGGTGVSIGNLTVNPSLGTVVVGGTAPTAAGAVSFTVNVQDTAGANLTQNYTLQVNPRLSLSTTTLPDTDVGLSYSQKITVSNGTPPYTIVTTPNVSNPAGITVSATNSGAGPDVNVSGIGSTNGTFAFTLAVTDAAGATLFAPFTQPQSYSFAVNTALSFSPTPSLNISAPPLNGEIQQATALTLYNRTITVKNGTAPLTALTVSNYLANSTGLTAPIVNLGLGTVTFNSTPSQAGNVTFTLSTTDSATPAATITSAYTIVVNPPMNIVPSALNGAATGVPTNQTITVSGGTKPYTPVSVTSVLLGGTTWGVNEPNFAIDQAGTVALTGTPTKPGLLSFDVNTTDSAGAMLTKHYTLSVFQFFPQYTATTVGVSNNQVLTITGGVTPYNSVAVPLVNSGGSSFTAANLPIVAGAGTVTLTGSSTTPGTLTFNITVTDANGASFTTSNSVLVNPLPSFANLTLPNGTYNQSYNQSNPATGGTGTLTYSISAGALPNGLSLNTSTGAISGTPTVPGTYNFTVKATDTLSAFGTQSYAVTINKQTPSLAWTTPSDITYGTALSATQLNASASGTGVPSLPGSFVYTPVSGTVLSAGNAQTLSVTFTPSDTTNYTNATTTVSINVLKKALSITANNQSKTYGQVFTFVGNEFTSSGLVNGDTINSVTLISSATPATATVAGSTYAITASNATGTGLSNYTISYTAGTFTVTPKALTVTANNQSKTYGTAFTFVGTEFTTPVGGLVNGDSITSVTLVSGGSAATATVSGSMYTITPSNAVGTGLSNYAISYATGTFTVSTKALTVTANNQSKTYGSTFTFLGTEFSTPVGGLVNGDTISSVTLVSGGSAATATVAGSTYTITASNATGTGLSNYAISYATGTFTVNTKALVVTANNQSKTYGTAFAFAGNEFSTPVGGLVNGDTINGVTLISSGTLATATVAGSTYAITASNATGTGLSNYAISYAPGAFTVNAKALTVTANNQSKTYGSTLTFVGTEFTTPVGGLVNGDTINSVTLVSGGSAATATVAGSTYTITPSNATGTGLSNYTISYAPGAFTVNTKSLTVTANNQSKTYGTAVTFAGTEFTTPVGGLVNGDTISSVTLVSGGTAATATVAGSTYTITASNAVGTGLSNYAISYAPGAFTVNTKALTVTANNQSKTYGTAFTFVGTEFTSTVGGLVNGDTINSVTLVSGGSAATASVAGSTYTITASNATGTGLSNYAISYATGTFTVTTKALIVTANNQSKTYGTAFTFVGTEFTTPVGGLVNGDTISSVTLVSSGTPATATVAGSTYAITASNAVGTGLSNYALSYAAGTFTVTTKALTVTPNNQTKTYGVTFTFAGTEFTTPVGGLVNGDTIGSVTLVSSGTPATATVVGSTYAITASNAVGTGLSNYALSYATGVFAVTPATLTAVANAGAKTFGIANPTFTGTLSGVLNGDGITATYVSTATTVTPAGTYDSSKAEAITPILADPNNALGNYSLVSTKGTLTINPAISITSATTLPNGALNIAYSPVTLTATGGTGTLVFTSGTLPQGLSLSTGGVLSGTPTQVVTSFQFLLTVTDSLGATALATCTITVTGLPPVINSVVLNPSNAFVYVGQTLSVTIGSVTTDDGKPAIVTITFGDGTPAVPVSGQNATTTHVYTVLGVYNITITATNQTSGKIKTVTIPIIAGLSTTGNTDIIGKSGQSTKLGFGATYSVNFGTHSKTTMLCRIVNLVIPNGLTQSNLTGANGTLTVGSGPNAVLYPFALTSKATAKTNLLTGITISIKDKAAQFTTVGDARLETYAESIGVTSGVKNVTKLIPVTFEIPGKIFIYARLEMAFVNPSGKTSVGKITK